MEMITISSPVEDRLEEIARLLAVKNNLPVNRQGDGLATSWDEVAKRIGVSRQAVHFWLHGALPSAKNNKRINRALLTLQDE